MHYENNKNVQIKKQSKHKKNEIVSDEDFDNSPNANKLNKIEDKPSSKKLSKLLLEDIDVVNYEMKQNKPQEQVIDPKKRQ